MLQESTNTKYNKVYSEQKSSNKKYQEAHRRPQKSIPEGYSRLCSDRNMPINKMLQDKLQPKKGPRSSESKGDQPQNTSTPITKEGTKFQLKNQAIKRYTMTQLEL